MRKITLYSSLLLMFAFCSMSMAQVRMNIICADKNVISVPVNDVRYMELVEMAGEGELDGPWFLGSTYKNGTATHYDATEVLIFSAGKMTWSKKTTDVVYTLSYPSGGAFTGATIKARREGSTVDLNFKILALDDVMLCLKQATSTYFFYRTRDLAINSGAPTRAPYSTPGELWASSLKTENTHSTRTPMGKHFESFAAATDEDKAWLADPNNQPDLAWHEVSGWQWTAKTITLYPLGTPYPADVNQHSIGDCCMCAVFASFAYTYPEWVKTLIEPNAATNPTRFTVHMFDPMGNPVDVVVDNKLMCNSSGSCGQVFGKNNKYNWATILEKALLKWESRFKCNKIEGIPKQHVTPLFTGNGDSFVFDPFKLYNSELRMIVDAKLREGKIIVGGFRESGYVCGDPNTKTVTGHAFSVMLPDEDSDCLFVMRNPWGQAGENNPRLDGKLLIPDDDVVPPLIDICIMEPGSHMAQYMKADLGEYTVPRFRPMYMDLNPTEEMLRRYNVKDYKLLPIPEDANPDDFATETDE